MRFVFQIPPLRATRDVDLIVSLGAEVIITPSIGVRIRHAAQIDDERTCMTVDLDLAGIGVRVIHLCPCASVGEIRRS